MKLALSAGGVAAIAAVGAAGVVALKLFGPGSGAKVKDAIDSVNPLNPNNVFKQGADAAASAIAGREETLGGLVHETIWGDPFDPYFATGKATAPAPNLQVVPGAFGGVYYDANGNSYGGL